MKLTGGCYCGQIRYETEGEPLFRVQCHCRECQYISGGNPNVIIGMSESGFSYSKGEPRQFRRSDLAQPVIREFCPECGTHLLTRSPRMPGKMLIKVGTLDDPKVFGQAQIAIFTVDRQSFHHLPEGVPAFERRPESYT